LDSYRRQLRSDGVINSKTVLEKEEALKAFNEYKEKNFEEQIKNENLRNTVVSNVSEFKELKDNQTYLENKYNNSSTEEMKKYYKKELEINDDKMNKIIDKLGNLKFDNFNLDDIYKLFANLKLDQIVSIFNLAIDLSLSFSIFNIINLFLGEHLIKYFNLENKYPKIAYFIRLRIKLNSHLKTAYLI
jgi:predicted nuclease with TOPRIM domain